jgi:CysZ protein
MFAALAKAIAQLPERNLRRVVIKTFACTVAVFAGLWFAVGFAVDTWLTGGEGWLNWLIGIFGSAVGVVITLVLFAPIATLVASLFQEEAADAVEAHHYPQLGKAPGASLGQSIWAAVRLVIWTVVVNLVCLPLYAFLPGLNLLIFFAINGYLLSREYFEVVALRRMPLVEASEFRRRHRFSLWTAGIAVAVLFWIPLLNLLAPIIGTAMMVHVVQGLSQKARQDTV